MKPITAMFLFLILQSFVISAFAATSSLKGSCLDYANGSNQIRFELATTTEPRDHESRDGSKYFWISKIAFDQIDSSEFGEMQNLTRAFERSENVTYYSFPSSKESFVALPDCRYDLRRCYEYFQSFDARLVSQDQEETLFRTYHCQLNK